MCKIYVCVCVCVVNASMKKFSQNALIKKYITLKTHLYCYYEFVSSPIIYRC